jgi:hypothetical protein
MSWLGKLNRYVLQWVGIRLAKSVETEGPNKGEIVAWQIIYPIRPVTGWTDSKNKKYRYLWGNEMKFINLWRKK